MTHPGTTEWACICKDCGADFRYSDTNYQASRQRGHSRPERCPDCRKHHAKEINTVGQPYFKVKPLYPRVVHERLASVLGRLNHPSRPHRAEHVVPPGEPPDKFGIKDDKIIEMFRWFLQDPGLQVVVVVGPTGSGKSTYFPYRLVHPPRWYTTTEIDPTAGPPASPNDSPARRPVLDSQGNPVRFDASDVPSDLFHRYGQIVVTQPRIQATRNIPGYIARAMLGSSLGAGFDIGYQYAKNPASDWRSKLRFCTDGSLINWIATGQLDKINTVMIDEAHERSLNIDIIIGLLTQALPRYPRLKLIIASATISSDLFISHFKKHLPQRATRELWIGDETKRRRKLDAVTKTTVVPMATVKADGSASTPYQRQWLLKPADNCELIEFDGKSFRVDPHFHDEAADGPPLEYAHLPPDVKAPQEKKTAEAAESTIQKLARTAHERVAKKAVALLRDMYLSAEDLRAGKGIRLTKSLNPDGTVPSKPIVIDVTERRGDILGFLHGEVPILSCCKQVMAEMRGFEERWCEVEALPLFTQLPQSEQDKALLERKPGIHERLAKRVVEQVTAGKTDILAVSDNVGAILGLESETFQKVLTELLAVVWQLDKSQVREHIKSRLVVQRWSGAESLIVTPGQPSQKNAKAKLVEKSSAAVRVVVASSRALAVWDVPYETAKDGDNVTLCGQTFTFLSQDLEIRRVVVSTNVAETSLTIHGILHVVDSGLINQNKWIPESQTTSVRAIVQSRAGCKQRWGRAGRLQAGDAWPLYTREQFGLDADVDKPLGGRDDRRCFPYYSQPEIRRSPLEQVLLTAKRAGLESLDVNNFPWLEAPDPIELARAERSLKAKGALDPQGRLTSHGLELSGFQSEARLANLMVIADRMACAVEMATVLAVLRVGYGKLFRRSREWDDATSKRVQQAQAALTSSCADDLEVALKIVAGAEAATAAGQALSDLLAWEDKWRQTRDAKSEHQPDSTAVRALLDGWGALGSEEEVAKARPPRNHPHRTLFNDLRVEIDRGVRRRRTWAEVLPLWEVLSKLPEFPDVWRAEATEATRIDCIARESLDLACVRPDLSEFLKSLDAIGARTPLKPGRLPHQSTPSAESDSDQGRAGESQAAETKAAEDALKGRKEAAEKLLASVRQVLDGFARNLPSRGTKIIDQSTGKERDDSDAVGVWKKLDSLADEFVKKLGQGFRCPADNTVGRAFVDTADAARTIEDLRRLTCENTEWVARVRAALPEAAVEAWCDAHFIDRRAISDKDKIQAARDELLDSLSGHKKEDERRPINFALLPRLRLIFAHALPDHCYVAGASGYEPIVSDEVKLPGVIERDSICASRSPQLLVCATKRSLPADSSGQARLGIGFVIALDGDDVKLTPEVVRGTAGDDSNVIGRPLAKWSAFELAAHLPPTPPEEAAQQTAASRAAVMFDQLFPMHSRWQLTLRRQAGESDWLASAALKELKPRILVEMRGEIDEEEVSASGDAAGGDTVSSTFAYEAPDAILSEEAPQDPDRRPIFLREGQELTTPLANDVRTADEERHEQLLREQDFVDEELSIDVGAADDVANRARPAAAIARPPVRIRFASPPPPGVAEDHDGAVIDGWVLGREMAGTEPVVLLARRSPRDWLQDLRLGQTKNIQVIDRASGNKPGLRVRIVGTDLEAIMTPKDFCFRDDDAVINEFVRASAGSKTPLSFTATVWELSADEGVLRLVTLPEATTWWQQYERDGKPDVPGKLVRSSAAKPDRASVILHSDPSRGLVVVAETIEKQFVGTAHGAEVKVRVERARTGRRSAEVRRPCPAALLNQLAERGVADVDGEKTRFVRSEPMTAVERFELIGLAPHDPDYRQIIDALYEHSNRLAAQEAGKVAALESLTADPSSEIVVRVTELTSGGVRLEPLDPQHPSASTTLWLSNRSGGASESLAAASIVIVRPLPRQEQLGQLEVTTRPPAGMLTNGTPIGFDRYDDSGEVRRVWVESHSGVRMVCPADEFLCNAPDVIPALLDTTPQGQSSALPFLVLRSERDRTDGTLSHRRAGAWALRCRNPKLEGQLVKGVVSRPWFTTPGEDVGKVQVQFGPKFRALVPIAQLGIGHWTLLKPDAVRLLEQGPSDMVFRFDGWDGDEYPLLSAQPVLRHAVDATLIDQSVLGEVVEVRGAFVNVRVAPFVIGSCHVSELGTERIDRIEDVIAVGDTLSFVVRGFDGKGHLQVAPREAALRTLEQIAGSSHKLVGTVSRIVGSGSLVVRLGQGITGYCPGHAMPRRVVPGEKCEVRIVRINRDADSGTPVQLSGQVDPSVAATTLSAIRAATSMPPRLIVPAPTLDLGNAIEMATTELQQALHNVEQSLGERNLSIAETSIAEFRELFPVPNGQPCHFSSQLALLRSTHDQLLERGVTDRARLAWPNSTLVPPDAPVSAVAELCENGSVRVRWVPPVSAGDDESYRVLRRAGDQSLVITEKTNLLTLTDPSPPRSVPLVYDVSLNARGKSSVVTATESLIVPGEVTQVVATDIDGTIRIQWSTPKTASYVEVWRMPGNDPPAHRNQGSLVMRSNTQQYYVDVGLPRSVAFGYLLVAVYESGCSPGLLIAASRTSPPSIGLTPARQESATQPVELASTGSGADRIPAESVTSTSEAPAVREATSAIVSTMRPGIAGGNPVAPQARAGNVVRIHYRVHLVDGTMCVDSRSTGAERFTIGDGTMLAGIEAAVRGMNPGESKSVKLSAASAHGAYDDRLVVKVPRSSIPPEISLDVGAVLQIRRPSGQELNAFIRAIDADMVVLDGNHPLAGHDLMVDIELLEITASPEGAAQ